MGLKEDLKQSPNRKLTDDELGKVAGGKGWDEDDLKSGMVLLLWENDEEWCYWHIKNASVTVEVYEYFISKQNPKTYIRYNHINGYTRDTVAKHLNDNGAKERNFPDGFVGV